MGFSLNLEKGLSLNLTKEFGSLTQINLGLGWDTRMDLDAFAILIGNDDNVLGVTYFANKECMGVSLSGDNLTGEGKGDDETIYVSLNSISKDIKKICFYSNIYNAGKRTFNDVSGSYIRLINAESNEELAKYDLKQSVRDFNAFHFADLIIGEDELSFEVIGEGLNGSIVQIKNGYGKSEDKIENKSQKKKWFWK